MKKDERTLRTFIQRFIQLPLPDYGARRLLLQSFAQVGASGDPRSCIASKGCFSAALVGECVPSWCVLSKPFAAFAITAAPRS